MKELVKQIVSDSKELEEWLKVPLPHGYVRCPECGIGLCFEDGYCSKDCSESADYYCGEYE